MGYDRDLSSRPYRGMLGGFTTLSTFALDAVELWENGEMLLAFSVVATSVVLGLTAAVVGLSIVRGWGLS